MKKLFVLICIVLMCSGCADLIDSDNDNDNGYDDNYCDGMSDDDGDGYFQKDLIPGPPIVFEKLMLCDGVQMPVVYKTLSYSVLRVSDCKYATISEDELNSYVNCITLEEVPDEDQPGLVVN